jgi:hypothetical protein
MPNWIGLAVAGATFVGIWFGHVGVRKIEAAAPNLWLPTTLAVIVGLALEAAAFFSPSPYVSGPLGILGMTVLFDGLEFTRQHNRVKHGHAPANPHNPRHARLLAEGGASTVEWLNRSPVERPVGLEEARRLAERGETAA